jgi:nuclear receptor interaction protein
MLGRDSLVERGQSRSPSSSFRDDDAMGRATQCVRRFAPNGRKRMKAGDHGHITACKISHARPNEMVVSWSGDHIYSFDLARSPDARDTAERQTQEPEEGSSADRARRTRTRKRKRGKTAASRTSTASEHRPQSRLRSEESNSEREMAFRVRYRNGNTEDIPFGSLAGGGSLSDVPDDVVERARESVLNEAQKLSLRIAKGFVEIRKLLFSVETSVREATEMQHIPDPTPYTANFSSILSHAATYLPEMDEVIRTWRYPINPTRDDVLFQQALRRNRESGRRFVQASGTLARVLGGHIHTASEGDSPQLELFRQIVPAPTENGIIDPDAQFGYDFLKAILFWLEHGPQAVVRGFVKTHAHRHDVNRFPIPESAIDDSDAIERYLIPYFNDLARDEPIVNVDASRFEYDETRHLFESQHAAIRAFAEAVKIPLEDLGDAAAEPATQSGQPGSTASGIRALNRRATISFWALKVGRGLLMDIGEGVNFEFVNRAFGGIRTVVEEDEDDEDDGRERLQEEIDPNEEEELISELSVIPAPGSSRQPAAETRSRSETMPEGQESPHPMEGTQVGVESDESENDDDEDDDDDEDEDEDEDEDTEDSDGEAGGNPRIFLRRGSQHRRAVESHVPCSSHINVYRGHCNVKTVKDVNYFGLDDEYVVSGSDDGNLFIWDRKTAKLVNILSGDSDTVNVVQGESGAILELPCPAQLLTKSGHPYEPTLAVSGIDQTIKIFSPDARAQHAARLGIDIADPDAQVNIISGARLGENRGEHRDLGLRSRKRMHDSYQIMSLNDSNRQGGVHDALITVRVMLQPLILTRTGVSFSEWASWF